MGLKCWILFSIVGLRIVGFRVLRRAIILVPALRCASVGNRKLSRVSAFLLFVGGWHWACYSIQWSRLFLKPQPAKESSQCEAYFRGFRVNGSGPEQVAIL